MHSHDLNLIAALADGSLEDETRALSRVESCADCRTEYETQKSALAALAGVGSTAMTEHEKASLHRDLWTELRTGAPVAKATAPWWYRWSYAAAGLFVVVGLAAILSQITDGGDTSAQLEETEGALPTAEDAPGDEDGPAADNGAAGGDAATSNLASAPETVAEADGEARSASAAESVDFAALAQALTETGQVKRTLTGEDQSVHSDCLIEAGLEDHSVIETYSLEAGDYLAVVATDAPGDSEVVTFVDESTCEVVYTDR